MMSPDFPDRLRTHILRRMTAVAVFVTLLVYGIGCAPSEEAKKGPPGKAELPSVDANVMTIAPQSWPRMIRSQGSLTADEVSMLGARVEGRVEQVHVDLGDQVKAKQLLVSLRKLEFQYRVAQAEAALLQARSAVGLKPGDPVSKLNPEDAPPVVEQKSVLVQATEDLDRAKRLQKQNTITAAELLQYQTEVAVAEARHKSALNSVREKIAQIGVREAELSLAREALGDTEVLAPFDGRVQKKSISPGAFVRVGDPLITLVKTDVLRYRGMIPERYALALSLGQEVQLRVESIPSPITVKVSRISPALDLSNRSLVYEAEVDNSAGALKTGLFAEGRVVIDPDATAIVIPRSALIEFAGAEKVWKVVEGESQEQEVLTGERRDDRIEILQGLKPGDRILVDAALGKPAIIKAIDSESSTDSGTAAVPGLAEDGTAPAEETQQPAVQTD